MVHSGISWDMCPRFHLRLPARRLAVRSSRDCLGWHSGMALASEDEKCLETPKDSSPDRSLVLVVDQRLLAETDDESNAI